MSTRTQAPYERKKAQEVAQMNKKVEANLVQQIQEASHLKAFKMSVLEQELEINEEAVKWVLVCLSIRCFVIVISKSSL